MSLRLSKDVFSVTCVGGQCQLNRNMSFAFCGVISKQFQSHFNFIFTSVALSFTYKAAPLLSIVSTNMIPIEKGCLGL